MVKINLQDTKFPEKLPWSCDPEMNNLREISHLPAREPAEPIES
jgi:hypothetical protein